jgi:hypothetical protein
MTREIGRVLLIPFDVVYNLILQTIDSWEVMAIVWVKAIK